MELNEVQRESDSATRKAYIFGVFALGLAGMIGYLAAHLVNAGPQTQPLVVAAVSVPPLTPLKLEHLKAVEWPVNSVPKGSFTKPEDVVKTGQMIINGLLPGEAVLAERLSSVDRGLGMSQMVEPNMRAFVVQVADTVATSEILHPGAFVDVVGTFDHPKLHVSVTKVILQNIQILGVGDSIEIERSAPAQEGDQSASRDKTERHRVVTLLVGTADVEKLSFASRAAKLDLALRNNNDNAIVASHAITFEKIIGKEKPKDPDDPQANEEEHPIAPVHDTRVHSRAHRGSPGPSIIRVNH